MLSLLEKAKTLKELMTLTESLKSGQLKLVEKAKTLKRVMELVELLGGAAITPVVKDYTKLLQSVINGEVNIVEAKEKFAELEQAIKDLGGEDMPDDDTKQLVIDALQAAVRQVVEANGYVVID